MSSEQMSQPVVCVPETDWVILKMLSNSMVSSHGEVESPLLPSGLAFMTDECIEEPFWDFPG